MHGTEGRIVWIKNNQMVIESEKQNISTLDIKFVSFKKDKNHPKSYFNITIGPRLYFKITIGPKYDPISWKIPTQFRAP